MSNSSFKRTLATSTTVHLVVVVLILVVPLIRKLSHPRKPPEMITFVDLSALPPPPPPTAEVAPEPEPEPPKPLPEPEPPKPAPIPEKIEEKKPAEKPKPEQHKIKVNTNKTIRRMDTPPRPQTPNQPTLTKEQIRKLLEANVKFSSSGSPSTSFSDLSLYYATVRDAMYGAWNQPSTVARGLVAEVSIKVQRSGAVTQRRLSRPSGNKVMDDSVMQAVNSISRLRALPAEIRDDPLDITIEFVVGDG